jgi:hypothetical protein
MNRRDALRLLATGTALHLAPGSLLAAMREARKLVEVPAALRTLNPHQDATVKVLAESLLPRTDTPGASDVGTTEFIDLMLTEWFDEPDRSRFLSGLAEVDLRTKTLFSRNFVDASSDQQAAILTWLGQKMTLAADPAGGSRRGSSRGQYKDFYSMFRSLTLTAYYTSEAGATGELHFQMVPGSYEGCTEAQPAKESGENE